MASIKYWFQANAAPENHRQCRPLSPGAPKEAVGRSSPIPPSWAQHAGKSLDGLGSPVSLSFPPWDGGDGGRDKKRNNSSGIHTQLSTKLKGKEKQLLQAATQPGTQRSWRDPSVGHELCNPIAKTALRKFPRKSKWTQEQAQTRNSSTAADPISPKHKSSPLPPGSPPNSTTTPWSCTQSTQTLPCPALDTAMTRT